MSRILELREKARQEKRRIVLPEGNDERVVKAASFIGAEGIADVLLIGDKNKITSFANNLSVPLEGVEIIDPQDDPRQEEVITRFYELRKHKGISLDEARKIVTEASVFYGAVLIDMGLADGFVAGAVNTSGNVARSAIFCLKIDKEVGTLSSSFIMEIENSKFGENGLFIFADCAIVPDPTAKQLAGIAISSGDMFNKLFGIEPKIAMLSYSTKGSAKSESIDKVNEALEKVKEKRPDLKIDGELQVDAALVPSVAALKCGDSPVAGKANVLIFPDLNAANIGYKLTQRLANARAVGPLLQGLVKPCSDLSRGCSWEDIVDAAAITAVRAQQN